MSFLLFHVHLDVLNLHSLPYYRANWGLERIATRGARNGKYVWVSEGESSPSPRANNLSSILSVLLKNINLHLTLQSCYYINTQVLVQTSVSCQATRVTDIMGSEMYHHI